MTRVKSERFRAYFASHARTYAEITGIVHGRRVQRVRLPALPGGTRFRIERRDGDAVPRRTAWVDARRSAHLPPAWLVRRGERAARWLVEFERPGFSPSLLVVEVDVEVD